ncbi:unnamed protein product [Owenia fusiformis]|uniref:Uncharacterized protein n=1 Tax=Owenia fusiformis TaxID=6347 RepID=A0A8J1USX6_OWEFU|nr:unnamed protein product [Owenia fusiformis]
MAASMENIFVREFERKNGSSLNISQCSTGDVGCVVWDAALVLMCYLEMPDFHNSAGESSMKEKIILELGSGTGAVGIQAACLGGNVTITDLKEFLPLMDLNIKNNAENITGTVVAKELKWGEDISSFKSPVDILLLADCIYYEESLEPLVQTIEDLSGPETMVLCCYEERTTGNKPMLQKKFFQLINKAFTTEEIPQEKQDPHYRSEDIHIIKFTKR